MAIWIYRTLNVRKRSGGIPDSRLIDVTIRNQTKSDFIRNLMK